MPPKFIIEPDQIPTEPVYSKEQIRGILPQRFEMEGIDAVTLLDPEKMRVAGYREVRADEFWVRGHMPGAPIMPGVMMCEAAAQLCAFYSQASKLVRADFVGFGGMDEVRFRGAVIPPCRLWLVGKTEKHDHRRMSFDIQGIVNGDMVFHGIFIGVPMSYPK